MRQTEYILEIGEEKGRGTPRARFPNPALRHIGATSGNFIVLIIEGEVGDGVIVDCKVLPSDDGPRRKVVGGSGESGLRERVAQLEQRVAALEKGGQPDAQAEA